MYKGILVLYFCFSLSVFAQSSVKINENIKVQTLVKKVKAAKPSDKRILMNRLKVMLRQSNKMHRMQIMKELKQSFSTGNVIHQGKKRRKHKATSTGFGKHQPKHKRYRDGSGKGNKQGRGHKK